MTLQCQTLISKVDQVLCSVTRRAEPMRLYTSFYQQTLPIKGDRQARLTARPFDESESSTQGMRASVGTSPDMTDVII